MAREDQVGNKNKFVMFLVLLSFIPFSMFIMNAEGNFRKSEIKKIAEKRRRRLDEEHDIDRDQQMKHFEELDKIYRISEKEEIKKYLEIGKTPKEYYQEQEARGFPKDSKAQDGSEEEKRKSKTQSFRETLMQKDDDGVNISII